MKSRGFRRFVAVFVGVLLVLAAVLSVTTGDEAFVGTTLIVAALYAVYMVRFLRLEKERREKDPKQKKSPLLRR